ncbi:MAG: radical SAM protein [Flexilinea flocculi]|jgi:hypothetical protein|nr:radical SAM protein [Flexilinea flocculi]
MNLAGLAFIMTDRCSASCGMCCFSCSPHNKQRLDKELVKDWIRQAADLGTVKSIGFSGGEAILYYDDLRECVAFAHQYGLYSTLVSNGFWAADLEKGRSLLGGLVKDGLKHLSLSVDQFHQEYVPLESVRNAMRLGEEFHVLSAVTLMELRDGYSAAHYMEALRPQIYGTDLIVYPAFPAGAANINIPEGQFIKACNADTARCPFDNHITILFDGSLMMCCSQFSKDIPPVHLGNYKDTTLNEAIQNFNDNPFIYVLLKDGFKFYVDLARSLGFQVDSYYCVSCHLCHHLLGNKQFLDAALPMVEEEASRLRVSKLLGR